MVKVDPAYVTKGGSVVVIAIGSLSTSVDAGIV
jgi:hypothetical protein